MILGPKVTFLVVSSSVFFASRSFFVLIVLVLPVVSRLLGAVSLVPFGCCRCFL